MKFNSGFIGLIQWKPFIMINLVLALFDDNNRLITLSGGYKNLHYLTQFIFTVKHFTCIKTTKFIWKTYVVLPVVCLQLVVPEWMADTHNASTNSKLEYRMLFPNNEPGNCWTTHLSFPLSWCLDQELNYRWRLKVRNG
jgi:hypothetical protein